MKKIIYLIVFLITFASFSQNSGTKVSAPNTSEIDSVIVLKSNKRLGHVPYTSLRDKLKGYFDGVYGATFTPTDLLTDYGFTDNSTNWNTAYGWGNHSGLYVDLTTTQTITGQKTFNNVLNYFGNPASTHVRIYNIPSIEAHHGTGWSALRHDQLIFNNGSKSMFIKPPSTITDNYDVFLQDKPGTVSYLGDDLSLFNNDINFLTSADLSNYATLSGGNTFTGSNNIFNIGSGSLTIDNTASGFTGLIFRRNGTYGANMYVNSSNKFTITGAYGSGGIFIDGGSGGLTLGSAISNNSGATILTLGNDAFLSREAGDLLYAPIGGGGSSTMASTTFTPYLTLSSTNGQDAVQELKDELDAAVIAVSGTSLQEFLTASGGETNWVLANTPSLAYKHQLYIGGMLMKEGTHYSVSGNTITFLGDATPLVTGDEVAFYYNDITAPSPGATISDEVYSATWNGDTSEGASKNALYDKINTLMPIDGSKTFTGAINFNNTAGTNIWSYNNISADAFYADNITDGNGYVSRGANSFTGYLFVGRNNATDTFTVNKEGDVVANTYSGEGKDLTLDASGFDGNLATTDDTLQKVAQKVDDLTTGGASIIQQATYDFVNPVISGGTTGKIEVIPSPGVGNGILIHSINTFTVVPITAGTGGGNPSLALYYEADGGSIGSGIPFLVSGGNSVLTLSPSGNRYIDIDDLSIEAAITFGTDQTFTGTVRLVVTYSIINITP